ncbi:membrane protein [Propionigenium maris DSM 9537]|uniref:Membrane protein n=1 Tax=Propionigenium maris DSM 9537 TaxID=1123000 RepID=A0A9W6LND9_9FUSO|nr:Bax inhibitor-1/YccA family protein [Propionigenium maris]GLI55820.1 membrane protein [Propionigenium maris DSM 9537]
MEVNRRSYKTREDLELIVGQKMKGVFLWMVIGILFTVGTAYYTLTTPAVLNFVYKAMMPIVIGELALVFILSMRVYKMDVNKSRLMFLLYSVLTGMTLSVLAIVYTGMSILYAFGGTTVIFVIMAVYGYATNEDLTKFGGILRMGLVTLIVLSLINLFLKIPFLYLMIPYLGVLVFIGLIGYDVNRIKHNIVNTALMEDESVIEKVSIIGALALYLDFINLFLYILRIFGKKR